MLQKDRFGILRNRPAASNGWTITSGLDNYLMAILIDNGGFLYRALTIGPMVHMKHQTTVHLRQSHGFIPLFLRLDSHHHKDKYRKFPYNRDNSNNYNTRIFPLHPTRTHMNHKFARPLFDPYCVKV
jgi:hypothetical protein